MDFAQSFAQLPVESFLNLVDEELQRLKADISVNTPTDSAVNTPADTASTTKRVILIGCHPRCGGTLLTQLFESDKQLQKDGVVIINEPHVFHRWVTLSR